MNSLNSSKWSVFRERLDGWADHDELEVFVDQALKGKRMLEVSCHEVLHAMLPHFNEARIQAMGKFQADLLWKLGIGPGGGAQ
ncbi:hypothetical protein LCGC14_0901780 [marine sediment metagenome]|uniref:Uncharacterized protein n=1 Tax=marine sediment metagenome TaxID=412755 RepID=A0A0F9P111_9ZZZZ